MKMNNLPSDLTDVSAKIKPLSSTHVIDTSNMYWVSLQEYLIRTTPAGNDGDMHVAICLKLSCHL